MFGAHVVLVNDSSFNDEEKDLTGPKVIEILEENGFNVLGKSKVSDERYKIEDELIKLAADKDIKLIVTAGGTGCAIRDNTPEATLNVCERLVPGLSEEMRRCSALKVRSAILSRGVCGIRHGTLIINLPGSPKAAEENLEFIVDLLPIALEIMSEEKTDCSKTGTQRHRR